MAKTDPMRDPSCMPHPNMEWSGVLGRWVNKPRGADAIEQAGKVVGRSLKADPMGVTEQTGGEEITLPATQKS